MEWEKAVALTGDGAPFIGQVLDVAFNRAQAVVVVLSGDDEARLRAEFLSAPEPEHETSLTPQARPNVLFEAGMAFGRCPERTILLQIGEIRPFSDIAGRHILRFSGKAEERNVLKERLKRAGCTVVETGSRWLSAGNYAFPDERVSKEPRRNVLDLVKHRPKVIDD